jgi:hydroxymethylpyrimidine/phosphomethylpyrimidine kinase
MHMQAVEELATALRQRPHLQIVVDPVLVATSGDSLASSEVGKAIADQ